VINWIYLIQHVTGEYEYDFHRPDVMDSMAGTQFFQVKPGVPYSEVLEFSKTKKKMVTGRIHRIKREAK